MYSELGPPTAVAEARPRVASPVEAPGATRPSEQQVEGRAEQEHGARSHPHHQQRALRRLGVPGAQLRGTAHSRGGVAAMLVACGCRGGREDGMAGLLG